MTGSCDIPDSTETSPKRLVQDRRWELFGHVTQPQGPVVPGNVHVDELTREDLIPVQNGDGNPRMVLPGEPDKRHPGEGSRRREVEEHLVDGPDGGEERLQVGFVQHSRKHVRKKIINLV